MPGANVNQLLAAALALSNTVACAPARGCLTSFFPSRFVAREDLALLRREYWRAESAPPPMRARMLQALPDLLPDLSNRRDAPTCAPEILERVATDLDRRPLPYSNATLHEIRTLGRVADTMDVMPEKARLLLSLASIDDRDVLAYKRADGEQGEPPSPSAVRRLALVELAGSNLFLNDARVKSFLSSRAYSSHDGFEQLLLGPSVREAFAQSVVLGPDLAHAWLDDTRQRLAAPSPDPVSLEVVINRLVGLGFVAKRYGIADDVRRLLEGIIEAEGAVPIAHGIEGASHDLAIRAMQASDMGHLTVTTFLENPRLPFPIHRVPCLDSWAFGEATTITWPDRLLASRLRDLDGELAQAHGLDVRCWLWKERAAWTPPSARHALLETIVGDASVPACGVVAALAMEGVAPEDLAGAAASLLAAPLTTPFSTWRAWAARLAVAQHPWWLDGNDDLRARLEEEARQEVVRYPPGTLAAISEEDARFEIQGALERAIRIDAVSPSEEARARARAVVAHWIAIVSQVSSTILTAGYPGVSQALLLGVADLAPRVGLEAEATPVLERVSADQPIARWLFDRALR